MSIYPKNEPSLFFILPYFHIPVYVSMYVCKSNWLGGDIARAADFMFFLITSLDEHTRSTHEEALINTYLHSFHAPSPQIGHCHPSLDPSRTPSSLPPENVPLPENSQDAGEGLKQGHGNGRCVCCENSVPPSLPGLFSGSPAPPMPPAEFRMYCRMAVQDVVYTCLLETAYLQQGGELERLRQLVERTCQAILDYDVHSLLAVGR